MKSSETYQPFFYIIRNTENGMMYAGSRTSVRSKANPDQLLTTYMTSSKTVQAEIEAKMKFEVVRTKTFSDAESTLAFESRFLRLYRCVKDKNWYNRHDGVTLAPFDSDKYQAMLQLKYGEGVTCPMHIPEIAQLISDKLKGAINCWDEEQQERRRVPIDEYKANPDRYWHIQSIKYRNKYKNGAKLEKFYKRVYHNVYNELNELVYHKVPKLEDLCNEMGMPYAAFQKSAYRGGERLYWTSQRAAHVDGTNLKYRGWYAIQVDLDDVTTNHRPIEPMFVSKRKPKEVKPKKEKVPHPTAIVISKGTDVIVIYRKSVSATANTMGICNTTIFKSIKSGNPLINGPIRETIALKEGKGWLLGCRAIQVEFTDPLVQQNLDKLMK